jgi:chromosome segregation ATPase
MDDASQHLLAAISRQLSDITANVQDVRERIIRLESQDYSPRLAKLETDTDDLKNRLTVIETRGQMFSAGVSAGVSVLVTVVGAALVHLFKG